MRVSTIHLTVDAGVERIEASSDALNSLSTVRIASSAGVDHEGGRRQLRSRVSEGGADYELQERGQPVARSAAEARAGARAGRRPDDT